MTVGKTRNTGKDDAGRDLVSRHGKQKDDPLFKEGGGLLQAEQGERENQDFIVAGSDEGEGEDGGGEQREAFKEMEALRDEQADGEA
jgi:hypothetical protein